ncbi:cytidylyltransferase domain-containing protein [Joostella sp.]|uniref:cytidylyltransferase domain-containing protein n=1 Tax=Joostella sp. TaxID=2231138 RepID=UPI003A923291
MEVGRQNRKVGFIIQARMKSNRLPGKVLMDMPTTSLGKPLLEWIINELRLSSYNNKIIIATSTNNENDVLESFCKEKGVECYRGDEDNVLSRFIEIVDDSNFDCIVRLTADNPILDISLLDKIIEYHILNENDYTKTSSLPLGMNFEVVNSKSMIELKYENLTSAENEHVTLFIRNNKKYKKGTYDSEIRLNFKVELVRLTVDYPSDFLLVSWVLQMGVELDMKGIKLIERLITLYPFMFKVNLGNFQKKQFNSQLSEIEYATSFLKEMELFTAFNILDKYKKDEYSI